MNIIRRILTTFLKGSAIYLFTTIFTSNYIRGQSLEQYLLLSRGGLELSNELEIDLILLIKVSLPIICYIYITSKHLMDDFKISSIYVFTRNVSVYKWYVTKILDLFTNGFVYTFSGIVITCILGTLNENIVVNYNIFIEICFKILILHSLVLFVYSLLINITSFIINPIVSYILSYFILTVSIITPMLYKDFIRNISIFTLPTSQYMIILYDKGISNQILKGLITINKFNMSYSVIYLMGTSIILGVSGLIIIKKLDIINFEW